MLFTDKAKSDPNSLIEVPKGGSFDDMLALKGDTEIGDKINKIISRLAEANDLQKVIDLADFNDEEKLGKGKEMQDRLSKLVTIFSGAVRPVALVEADGDTMWRLCTRGITPQAARARVRVQGDLRLADQVLEMVSIIW